MYFQDKAESNAVKWYLILSNLRLCLVKNRKNIRPIITCINSADKCCAFCQNKNHIQPKYHPTPLDLVALAEEGSQNKNF